mgnify:CR=1 FL=1
MLELLSNDRVHGGVVSVQQGAVVVVLPLVPDAARVWVGACDGPVGALPAALDDFAEGADVDAHGEVAHATVELRTDENVAVVHKDKRVGVGRRVWGGHAGRVWRSTVGWVRGGERGGNAALQLTANWGRGDVSRGCGSRVGRGNGQGSAEGGGRCRHAVRAGVAAVPA